MIVLSIMNEKSSSLNIRKIRKKSKKLIISDENRRTYDKEKKKDIPRWKRILRSIFSYLFDISVVLAIVIIIRMFIASPFSVRGHSMDNSFHNGDFIIVDQVYLYFNEPSRGDVIVFRPPSNKLVRQDGVLCFVKEVWAEITNRNIQSACLVPEYFVKRVIGLPGDIVKIQNGKVYITDNETGITTELIEPYLSSENQGFTCLTRSNSCTTTQDIDGKEFLVPYGEYFVLGDNRKGSNDSRHWTDSSFVPLENVRGKVRVIIWPISDFSWVTNH